MSFLSIAALSKRYRSVAALVDVSLDINVGGRTAIVGPSGSGKTTLLRLLAGFDIPDSGRINLDGRLLADGANAVPAHRRDIGVVMQDGALFPHLTVAENIGFGLSSQGGTWSEAVADLSDMVGLDRAMLSRKPDALSGGQQQRVALARALARQPKLMLLDEPFSALDTGLRASTRKAVAELLKARGVTTILVTHDQAEALSFADHVAIMECGRILQAGPPRELYFHPATAMIAMFLGDAVILPAALSNGWANCVLGRVAIDDAARAGSADIMIRPEQILLGDDADGVTGQVLDVEFAGSTCMVTIEINGHSGAPIVLRQPSSFSGAPGNSISLAVSGPAHALG